MSEKCHIQTSDKQEPRRLAGALWMTRDLRDQAAAAAFCFAPRWIARDFFDSIGQKPTSAAGPEGESAMITVRPRLAVAAQFRPCAASNAAGESCLILLARFATLSVPRPAAGL